MHAHAVLRLAGGTRRRAKPCREAGSQAGGGGVNSGRGREADGREACEHQGDKRADGQAGSEPGGESAILAVSHARDRLNFCFECTSKERSQPVELQKL